MKVIKCDICKTELDIREDIMFNCGRAFFPEMIEGDYKLMLFDFRELCLACANFMYTHTKKGIEDIRNKG